MTNIESRSNESGVMDNRVFKVILHISNVESGGQRVVVSQIRNILKSLPNAKIDAVFHSKGLTSLVAEESEVVLDVGKLIEQGVTFSACENAMKSRNIIKSSLLPGVQTVPSAMAYCIMRQAEGWIYVRGGT